jgi:hypothetical protein
MHEVIPRTAEEDLISAALLANDELSRALQEYEALATGAPPPAAAGAGTAAAAPAAAGGSRAGSSAGAAAAAAGGAAAAGSSSGGGAGEGRAWRSGCVWLLARGSGCRAAPCDRRFAEGRGCGLFFVRVACVVSG